ncbi:DUF3800 domain-containing protein [uncultured Sphaerochaeta sp.]|uniref:DUF3800 domain-containing protein n=1 Tax=uncultured Sphaerochaeta sp. TaxID=886478 RepID=UPI002A0A1FD6|nr:DUF3800 domain-containing protein [uncultured Sphaerochaeta sp.]
MFVYIDEAGHTGKNSKDPEQPVFHYMAAASTKNLDLDIDGRFKKILIKNGISEIHGAENVDKLEAYASDLLKILSSNSVSFFYSIIEKDFMAYAKLYDTLFDNIENKGARFQAYQVRTLRLTLLGILMEILPVEIAHSFYEECLFAGTESDSKSVLIDTCKEILARIHRIKDERARQIISDAAEWAMKNPSGITTYTKSRKDRWMHLPHVAGFLPLMSMLSNYSSKHKSPIMKITHDNQDQIRKILSEIHRVASDPEVLNTLNLGENGTIELKQIKKTSFEISDSSKSFGLQTVDICLYVLSHSERIQQMSIEWPNTYNLLEYVGFHTSSYILTKERLLGEAIERLDRTMNTPLSEEVIERSKQTIEKWEMDFQAQPK